MKVEVTFKEIEKLIAPSSHTPIKLEYIGLNSLRLKYGRFDVKVNIVKVENDTVFLKYELDLFRNIALHIGNYLFKYRDRMNLDIFSWDIDKKIVAIQLAKLEDLKEFRKLFTVSNILINSIGLFIYFKVKELALPISDENSKIS